MCSEAAGWEVSASIHIFRFSVPAGNAHRGLSRSSSASSTHATHRWPCGCQRACSQPPFRPRGRVEFATPNARSQSANHHSGALRGRRRRLRGGCTPRRRLNSCTAWRRKGVPGGGEWHPSCARAAVSWAVLYPAWARSWIRSHTPVCWTHFFV